MNKDLTKDEKFANLREKYPKGTYPSLEEYNKMDSVEKTFFDLPDILNSNIGEEWKELDHQKLPVNEEIKLSDKLIHSLKLQKEDDPRFYLLKTLSKRQIRLFDDEGSVKRLPNPPQNDSAYYPTFTAEDFKMEGNPEYAEAKSQAFVKMLAYIKLLQVYLSDWIMMERVHSKELKEDELVIWYKMLKENCNKIVEEYSIMELCELHTDNIQHDYDTEGNIDKKRIKLKDNVYNTHRVKFPNGDIGICPATIGKNNKTLSKELVDLKNESESNRSLENEEKENENETIYLE